MRWVRGRGRRCMAAPQHAGSRQFDCKPWFELGSGSRRPACSRQHTVRQLTTVRPTHCHAAASWPHQRVHPGCVEVDCLVPGSVQIVGHDVDPVEALAQRRQVQPCREEWEGGEARRKGVGQTRTASTAQCRTNRAAQHMVSFRQGAGWHGRGISQATVCKASSALFSAPCQPLGPAPVAIVRRYFLPRRTASALNSATGRQAGQHMDGSLQLRA